MIALLRLLVGLPFAVQTFIGRTLGWLAWLLSRRYRHIGQINLKLCFPDWTALKRRGVLRRHFESLGCAFFDTGLAWWASDRRILALTEIAEGAEELERALAVGRGALLVSAHFTAAQMGVRALAARWPVAGMYQVQRNAVVSDQFSASRGVRSARMIPSHNVRAVLRALGENLPVWFAADQREHMRSCTLAPFFGVAVLSNTAPSRLARISGAPVLPYFVERVGGSGYRVRIGRALAGFPSQDPAADAARLHALIEADVRRVPEQYLWTYKRFKRPGVDPYRK